MGRIASLLDQIGSTQPSIDTLVQGQFLMVAFMQTVPNKLIEICLPLGLINREAERENHHPHKKKLWASGPTPAVATAVLFAQLIQDPEVTMEKRDAVAERLRLFKLFGNPFRKQNLAKLESQRLEFKLPRHAVPAFNPRFSESTAIMAAVRWNLNLTYDKSNSVAALLNSSFFRNNVGTPDIGQLPAGDPLTLIHNFAQTCTAPEAELEELVNILIQCGLQVTAIWPVGPPLRSGRAGFEQREIRTSSVVVVCRKQFDRKPISKTVFLRKLYLRIPEALDELANGAGQNERLIDPLDLTTALIGKGMAVYSQYSQVLAENGQPVSVSEASTLIRSFFMEEDLDPITQFCFHWWHLYGFAGGPLGEADVLARAKGVGLKETNEMGLGAVQGSRFTLNHLAPAVVFQSQPAQPVWGNLLQSLTQLSQTGDLPSVPFCEKQRHRLFKLVSRLRVFPQRAHPYNDLTFEHLINLL